MTRVRKAGLGLLALLLAVCLGVGLASCGSKDETPTYGYGEEGTYYYTESSGEDLLTLRQGTYILTLGSSGHTGTYGFSEGSLTLFEGDEETGSGALTDGGISLTWEGRTYLFLTYEYYTVSFMDGSSTITTQSVLNGKAAQDPGDATKEGYVFLGWYADSSFTTRYEFNTSITGNTTIYARFVELTGTTEYKVTCDFGNGETMEDETINGRIYDLPEAEMSGYTFLGWWVSATNDADELTYRYDGETLCEDTTLFAVYASGSYIGASIKDGTLTWLSSPGSQMSVTVTDGEGDTLASWDQQATQAVSYDFSSLSAGKYKVTVTSGGVTETLVYVSNGLSRVSGFTVISGSILMYGAVANAERYYISIDCGTEGHDHTYIDNGSSLYYDFSSCEMPSTGITFTVYAYADGYYYSVSSYNYFLGLEKTEVTVEGSLVSWTPVSYAMGYEVYIGGTLVATTSDTSFSLSGYGTGTYEIAVKPITTGYYSELSEAISFTKTTLASPEISGIDDYTITWTEVEGATGYTVSINGTETTVGYGDMTSLILSDDNYTEGLDSYEISVKALAPDSANDSPYGETITVTGNSVGSAVSYGNGTVTWQYSLSASEYRITVNDGDEISVTGTNSTAITLTKSGNNEITIYFVNEDNEIYGTASIMVYAYAIVFDARGGTAYLNDEEIDTIYVAKGDTITLPEAETAGYTFAGWYTLPDLSGSDAEIPAYGGDGVLFEDGTVFTGNSTIVLYAFYMPRAYTITLVVDGEVIGEQTVYSGRSYTLPTVEKEGLYFYGWYSQEDLGGTRYTDENGSSRSAFYAAADVTLYAGWRTLLEFTLNSDNASYSVSKGSDIGIVNEVTIPATYMGLPVTTINSGAFTSCSALYILNIPDTVTFISVSNNGYSSGTGAFASSSNIREVNVYATSEYDEPDPTKEVVYYSEDGVLFMLNSLTGDVELVYYPHGKTGAYRVPETVSNEFECEYDAALNIVPVERRVTSIGTQVFKSNTNLTEIVIPATVESISTQAFQSCTKLTGVVFEEAASGNASLTLLNNVFQSCSALTEVTLPSHMSEFNSTIFTSCSALENVYVARDGGNYTSRDGLLCDSTGTEVVYCPKGRTSLGLTDARVTRIGDGAFSSCTKLITAEIPAWVSYIGENAFEKCTKLTTLVFDGDATSPALTIAASAFYGCTKLTEIHLPENLYSLGEYAFGGCSALRSVYVESAFAAPDFAANAFASTSGAFTITYLRLGDAVGDLDITAVFGATITTVEISPNNPYYVVYDDVIYDAAVTEIKYFPFDKTSYTTPDSLLAVPAYVFTSRTGLESVTIGASVAEIGEGAFYNCTALKSVTFLYDGTGAASLTIGDYAFYGCRALTELNLPANLTALGAYDGNGNLTRVYTVFEGCTSLKAVNVAEGNACYASVGGILYSADGTQLYFAPAGVVAGEFVITSDVVKIWDRALYGNTGITKITFEGTFSSDFEIGEYAFAYSGVEEMNLPSGITSLTEGMFAYCTSLKTVTIPNTVTSMAANVFEGCSLLSEIIFEEGNDGAELTLAAGSSSKGVFMGLESLTSVILPERVASIPTYAFYNCTALTYVYIPAGVTEIGNYAFAYSGTSVEGETLGIEFGEGSALRSLGNYAFARRDTALYDAETGNFSTDWDLSGFRSLTSLGTYVFYYSNITGMIFPDTVTETSTYTFQYSSLRTLKGDGLVTVGNYALGYSQIEVLDLPNVTSVGTNSIYSTPVTEVNLPSLTTIGNFAFYSCENLKEIRIPGTLTSIGNSAFRLCTGLVKVEFASPADESVKFGTWGTYVFADCTSLVEANVPSSMRMAMGTYAFYNCTSLERIDMEEGVTSIGNYDFQYCSSLKTVTIPASVTSIGTYAFQYCDSLEEVVFAEGCSLTSFGNYDFQYCSSLRNMYTLTGDEAADAARAKETRVTIPATVQTFGTYLFSYCTSLGAVDFDVNPNGLADIKTVGNYDFEYSGITSVVFPESSSTISLGTLPFRFCESLTYVYISASVADIANKFDSCQSIALMEVAPSSTVYATGSVEGMIFSADLKAVALVYAVPEDGVVDLSGTGITAIGENVFSVWADTVTEVRLPSDLTSIGDNAFADCTALTTVAIPDSVTSIGSRAFNGCSSLKTLVLPDGLTTIGQFAFGASGLTSVTIPAGVTSLPDGSNSSTSTNNYGVFGKCTSLTKVEILGTVTSIGSYAFYGCTALEEINLPYGLTEVGTAAFYNCKALKEINLPDTFTTLADYCFASCTSVTTITLPAGVTEIPTGGGSSSYGRGVFGGCTSLEEVIFLSDSFASIGAYAFYGDTALSRITIPSTVTTIGNYAFYQCSSLTGMTIPDSVTSIGTYAFRECSSLSYVRLPENSGFTAIPNYCFYGCPFEEIYLPSQVTAIGTYAFCSTGLKSIDLSNIVSFDSQAFRTCTELEEVIFNDSLTDELSGVTSLFYGCTSLTHVDLPDTLTELGTYTFQNSGLVSITIPAGVTAISNQAFRGTPIESVEILGTITSIGYGAFYGCENLETVEISSVTTLEYNAFRDCTSLTYIDTSSVTEIGYYAFSGCTNLHELDLSSVTSLSYYVFSGSGLRYADLSSFTAGDYNSNRYLFANCTELEEVVFNDSLTVIPNYCFYGCTSLAKVTTPLYLTRVSEYAFYGCETLSVIEPMMYLENIGTYAFYGCGLEDFTIAQTVTAIGDMAFGACANMNDLTVSFGNEKFYSVDGVLYSADGTLTTCPAGYVGFVLMDDGATAIAASAFSGCALVTALYVPAGVTSVGDDAFSGCDGLAAVYYEGTEEGFALVDVSESGNSAFLEAELYLYSETEPDGEGNFWHWDENWDIAVWTDDGE